MFRLINLIVLANLITACLSCLYCLNCNSIVENKMNAYAAFSLPDMVKCLDEKKELSSSLCSLKYCSFEVTVDFAYEDLNNKKIINDVKAKYIKLSRGCKSAPALKDDCNLFNNTEKRTFRKSCVTICNTQRCNEIDPRIPFNGYKGVDAYPQCQICEETIYIESITDSINSTSCFITNKEIWVNELELISCVGLCFSHIRYNDLKVTYEKGCYSKLQEILKKSYSVSDYMTCDNADRRVCNKDLRYSYIVIKNEPEFKKIYKYIETDLEKKRTEVDSTKCRICGADGDPTKNAPCKSKQITSSKQCTNGCSVVLSIIRLPHYNKKILTRKCSTENNRTGKLSSVENCLGQIEEKNKRIILTMKIKNDFTIKIGNLVDCISICLLYYRDTCIGYNFNEKTHICEGYTTKGNTKEMEHTFYKVDRFILSCELNCKRGLHTECANGNAESLEKKWREKMATITKFEIITKSARKDTNAKTSESIGDPNTTLMIIVVFVTCVISLLAIFVSIRRGLSKYPKTNKKEIFVDSSRIQPYYSGAE